MNNKANGSKPAQTTQPPQMEQYPVIIDEVLIRNDMSNVTDELTVEKKKLENAPMVFTLGYMIGAIVLTVALSFECTADSVVCYVIQYSFIIAAISLCVYCTFLAFKSLKEIISEVLDPGLLAYNIVNSSRKREVSVINWLKGMKQADLECARNRYTHHASELEKRSAIISFLLKPLFAVGNAAILINYFQAPISFGIFEGPRGTTNQIIAVFIMAFSLFIIIQFKHVHSIYRWAIYFIEQAIDEKTKCRMNSRAN